MEGETETGETSVALLTNGEVKDGPGLVRRVWAELKHLWPIVVPSMIGRLALSTMPVITQAYAGHIGDLELASFSIAFIVVASLAFGLLLGIASALETLCGQDFGAKKYHMLGVYMQRSTVVLFLCALLLLPLYICATQLLELLGQSKEIAREAGDLSLWLLPLHYSYVFMFRLPRFLQCQLKYYVNAAFTVLALLVHIFISWLFGADARLRLVAGGGGSVGVRRDGKGARFATIVSVTTSAAIGLIFWSLIIAFHDKIALIFSSSSVVLEAVDRLRVLSALTVLLDSVQPVISGSYYFIGIPFGIILGWILKLGVLRI
ncbi:hypothetical protein OPV22_021041 [Ensete ventricosum]|uniref:Protein DETOXIFICATION n=1 Tax=Ensete ventricosum TaxID=4639 RepID=A0AAV8QL46_ENSVE|nr:hypothetical protein OPV22_021041 [Ensete ventricosum]